jgi:pyruvate formate lyase activating enzyme
MKYFKYDRDKNIITCLLCRHYCKLKDGNVGICGVNKNVNNSLKNLVYSHPVALNVDPVEKKPLYHFLPNTLTLSFGTVGCNFKCPFCQNWSISQEKTISKDITVSALKIVDLAQKNGCSSIAYTYNEPTIFYPYAKDIGIIAKNKGIKNIFVSNGFESQEIIYDMSSWLDAANIDLKSWSDSYYRKTLKGGLEEVKETLRLMVELGIWVEVTTLLIEGENDSEKDIYKMAEFIADDLGKYIPWHLSAFHPDYKMKDHKNTTVETLQKAYDIAKKVGLEYVYLGNVSLEKDTNCPKCNELLISRKNYHTKIKNFKNGHCLRCNNKIKGVWS